MELTPQAVDAYKQILSKPKEHGLNFPGLADAFEQSDEATAKHILYKQYSELIQTEIPKVIFYIIMDDLYPQAHAADGNLGYRVRIVDTIANN